MSETPITAKAFLKKIGDDEKLIRQKLHERVYWEELALSTTAGVDKVRVKSSSDGTTLQKQIAEIVLIDGEIERLKNDISYRIAVIGELPADEYVLLHQVYVQHISFRSICKKEKKSYSWIMKLHHKALAHLQRIIDEVIYT